MLIINRIKIVIAAVIGLGPVQSMEDNKMVNIAPENENISKGGIKRALLKDNEEDLFPYWLIEEVFYTSIAKNFGPDLETQQAQLNSLRLVSTGFNRVVDHLTRDLDLSGLWWTPYESRPYNGQTFEFPSNDSWKGYSDFLYENGQLFKSIAIRKKVHTCSMQCPRFSSMLSAEQRDIVGDNHCDYDQRFMPLSNDIKPTIYVPCFPLEGKNLWNSEDIQYDYDPSIHDEFDSRSCFKSQDPFFGGSNPPPTEKKIMKNLVRNYFRDLSRDFKELKNLTSLTLNDNTAIQDVDLGVLTKLKSLSLVGNSTITDESVSRLTNLQTLNLKNNKTITDKSVSHLLNLENLNLASDSDEESKVRLDTLRHLPRLKKLTLGIKRQGTGVIFDFPSLQQLHFTYPPNDIYWVQTYQQAMNMAEGMFLYIENNKEKLDYSAACLLKEEYISTTLLPFVYYDLNSEILLDHVSVSFTVRQMREIIEVAKDQDDGEYSQERAQQMTEIIKSLREISKKDLKITLSEMGGDNDDEHVCLGEDDSWY